MERKGSEKQTPLQFRCKKILPVVSDMDKSKLAAAKDIKVDETQEPAISLVSPTPEKLERRIKVKEISDFARRQLAQSFQDDGVADQAAAVDRGDSHILSDDDDDDDQENTFEPEFPVRSSHMLRRSLKDKSFELPDNYKTLANLFNRMESSIRLLGLRKMLSTFRNISSQVEVLTKRKFLSSHLAQMKHLFSEAIQIDKILVHDERSLCMIPEMKITLLWDVVECPPHGQSAAMALCEAFHARLVNFCNSHPEGTDIPEAVLPEPFNPRKDNMLLRTLPEEFSTESSEALGRALVDHESLPNASHLPLSFQRQFSQKVVVQETHKTQLLASPESLEPISTGTEAMEYSSSQKEHKPESFESVSTGDEAMEYSSSQKVHKPESFEALSTGDEAMEYSSSHKEHKPDSVWSPSEVICAHPESTPVKVPSTLDVVMTDTPLLQTPKRAMPTPSGELVTDSGKSVSESRLGRSARRSLIYSPSKSDGNVSGPVACRTEEDKAIRYSCHVDPIRSILGEEITDAACDIAIVQNEEKNNQMGEKRGQEMLACLLDTFDAICLISRSTNCSLITKEELVHKILSNNFNIEETSEVEEQLGLLEELVPDWICKKSCSGGNFLYCIKQSTDSKSIREKLVEAV